MFKYNVLRDYVKDHINNNIKSIYRTGLAALVAGATILSPTQKADASLPLSALGAYTQTMLSVPANSGVDTDADGLSDSYETNVSLTNPNDASTNPYDFPDNAFIESGITVPGKGEVALSNLFEKMQTVPQETNRHHLSYTWSRDGKKLYYISAGDNGTLFTDPILYMKRVGSIDPPTQLTTSGQLGPVYEFQSGSSLLTNDGVVIHANLDGIYGSGGKILKVTDAGVVSDFFVFSDGKRAIDAVLHRYSDIGDFLITNVLPVGFTSIFQDYIAAYPIVSGVPNQTDERVIVQTQTTGSAGGVGQLRFPIMHADGTTLGFTKVTSGTNSIPARNLGASVKNVIQGTASSFSDVNSFGFGGRGSYLGGLLGGNVTISGDFSEQVFNWASPVSTLPNSDFNLRKESGFSIRYVGNQFFPKLSPEGNISFSSDTSGDGYLELYVSSLRTDLYIGDGILNNAGVSWYDMTGSLNTMPIGTIVDTPLNQKVISIAPSISLADLDTTPFTVDRLFSYTKTEPAGTLILSPAKTKDANYAHFRDVLINPYWIDLGVNPSTISAFEVTPDGMGGFIYTPKTVVSSDADSIKFRMEGYSNFALGASFAGGLDLDGDGLSGIQENYLGTNPSNPDTNNNGINDGEEDADGDGVSNRNEFIFGSDPLNPNSTAQLPINPWAVAGGALALGVTGAYALSRRKRYSIDDITDN